MPTIKRGVELVIAFMVVGILAAAMLPEAVNEIINVSNPDDPTNATYSDWGGIEQTLFELLPLAVVLAVFLFFIGWAVDLF